MTIQKPQPLTESEAQLLKECLNLDLAEFKNMIGPNVELIERYHHAGIELDEDGDNLKECTKEAPIYGLVYKTFGHSERYERFFFWHGYCLYSADSLKELFRLIQLFSGRMIYTILKSGKGGLQRIIPTRCHL